MDTVAVAIRMVGPVAEPVSKVCVATGLAVGVYIGRRKGGDSQQA